MEAALGIIITLLVALLGLLLHHISNCSAFHERVASLESDMRSVKSEIGTAHNEGMRHRLHKSEGRIKMLAQKMGMETSDDN